MKSKLSTLDDALAPIKSGCSLALDGALLRRQPNAAVRHLIRRGIKATRREIGLPSGGPSIVVTDKAIFDFDPDSHCMRLVSLHPDVELGDVLENMSFSAIVPQNVGRTRQPSEQELHVIRSVIDPQGTLIGHERHM